MPNVVKGSKQERMVVVPYRPWRRLRNGIVVVLLLSGGVGAGYWSGLHGIGTGGAGFTGTGFSGAGQANSLQERAAILEDENTRLKQEVALLERSSSVDQQANSEVQATITELREYIASLEQDVQFYRQAMTSEFEDVGLVVGQMDLQGTDDPRRFHYKLVMRQEESSGEYLTGYVNVDVIGEQGGQPQVISLHELTDSEEQKDIKLRFRYFQNIEGDLELPAEFVPQQININAVATAPMAKSIDKSYNWVVEGE